MEDKNYKSAKIFFKYLIIGYLISCVRTDMKSMGVFQVLGTLFFTFWYNLIVGIFTGIAAMFTSFIYEILKKRNGNILNHKLCF